MKMDEQLPLVQVEPRRQIISVKDRPSPAAWVREIRVLSNLKVGREHEIRKIVLRRGLNILWAKASTTKQQLSLFDDSISGHSAGKTTCCRFLRYVLGEPHFGDARLRQEIRARFPDGWAVACVVVADQPWIVCRPLGIGSHPFAARSDSIDEVLAAGGEREPFLSYLEALSVAVIEKLPRRNCLTSGKSITWDHLLAWLARDQGCHFDKLIDWRDPSSESDSPQLDSVDRHLLLRAMLGLIDQEEDRERQTNDRRLAARKKLQARLPKLIYQANIDWQRLERLLDKQLPPFDDALFRDAVKTEIDCYEEDLVNGLNSDTARTNHQLLDELEAELDIARNNEAQIAAQVKDTDSRLQQEKNRLMSLRGAADQAQRDAFLSELPPSSRFCNVPIELARTSGCPLAMEQPFRLAEHAAERTLDDHAAIVQRIVTDLERILSDQKINLASSQGTTVKLRERVLQARRQRDADLASAAEQKALVGRMRWLAENAQATWQESEAMRAKINNLERQIKRSHRRQEKIREAHASDLQAFSRMFDHFISALLGERVKGQASFSGRDIDLKVLHRGERRSAAIKIVKNLAFDLASVASGMEGRGYHPRLLIHDGPRESDMSVDLYRKVFLLMQSLETPSTNEPSFQYIITTTEAPPEALQRQPWLIDPVLDASDPEKRFLGVDL